MISAAPVQVENTSDDEKAHGGQPPRGARDEAGHIEHAEASSGTVYRVQYARYSI